MNTGFNIFWDITYLIFWVIAVFLVYNVRSTIVSMFINKINLLKWLLVSIVVGIILPYVVYSFTGRVGNSTLNNNVFLAYFAHFFGALGNEVIEEEPLFGDFYGECCVNLDGVTVGYGYFKRFYLGLSIITIGKCHFFGF